MDHLGGLGGVVGAGRLVAWGMKKRHTSRRELGKRARRLVTAFRKHHIEIPQMKAILVLHGQIAQDVDVEDTHALALALKPDVGEFMERELWVRGNG